MRGDNGFFPHHMLLPPSDVFARKLGHGSLSPQMQLVLQDSSLPCIASCSGLSCRAKGGRAELQTLATRELPLPSLARPGFQS